MALDVNMHEKINQKLCMSLFAQAKHQISVKFLTCSYAQLICSKAANYVNLFTLVR